MKRFVFVFAFIMALVPAIVIADIDIDLSKMTFQELVDLHEKVNLAIWNSEEWESVRVPQGTWEIGVDIPEGHWTIRPDDGQFVHFQYGNQLDENGKEVSYFSSNYYSGFLYSKKSAIYREGEMTMDDIKMKSGNYLYITSGNLIFTPYSGKAELGFKK